MGSSTPFTPWGGVGGPYVFTNESSGFLMHSSWKEILAPVFKEQYFKNLASFVETERKSNVVYPPPGEVFTAFEVTPYDKVRVVILGQDPYHGAGQAHGMSFSVKPGTRLPPSLANIYKELEADLGISRPREGYLIPWAEQGVFLLNAVLTVRAGEAGSHQGVGWERFTDSVITALNNRRAPTVFVLWGRYAREKKVLIDESRHKIIESAHPSPLSAHNGFFESKPFSKVNAALVELGHPEIDWKF